MSTVRPATSQDLPYLAAVEDAADGLFAERFGGVDWPAADSGEDRAAEPGFLLVAVEPDDDPPGTERVVGFAHVLELDGRWHLDQVAVLPERGRRGHGSALLAALCREVATRGGAEVTLTTYADVPWNAPFYARHGWVELDPWPDHLAPFAAAEERMDMGRHGRRVAMSRRVGRAG
ncbi:GNAT family N-acetyltransferase [Oryzobacter terrae]|uniref:GNAT family N-acetyltransferase n=1 Tax=Oryzobacter terrae TaxID=1620385 RepID=UPI00366D8282